MNYSGVATGGGGFNKLSAGRKVYGGGRDFPTMGRVDPMGYRERDAQSKARVAAMRRRISASQTGRNFSSAWLSNGGR